MNMWSWGSFDLSGLISMAPFAAGLNAHCPLVVLNSESKFSAKGRSVHLLPFSLRSKSSPRDWDRHEWEQSDFHMTHAMLGASIYDVRTEGGRGVPSKADIVCNLSKGGWVNLRTRGEGSKNMQILRTSYMEAPSRLLQSFCEGCWSNRIRRS